MFSRRQFVYGVGGLLGSTLVGCGRAPEQSAASNVTVFVNGTILPVDAAFSEHAALAIAGNQVLAVGSTDEVLAAAGSVFVAAKLLAFAGGLMSLIPVAVGWGLLCGLLGGFLGEKVQSALEG